MNNVTSKENLLYAIRRGYAVADDGTPHGPRGALGARHDRDGYRTIGVKMDGKVVNVHVHRIMGYQKFGAEIFGAGMEVRHLNNNKDDNSRDNIGIGDHRQNMMDKPPEDRLRRALIASTKRRRYDDATIAAIREAAAAKMQYRDISAKFGVPLATVHYMVNRAYY